MSETKKDIFVDDTASEPPTRLELFYEDLTKKATHHYENLTRINFLELAALDLGKLDDPNPAERAYLQARITMNLLLASHPRLAQDFKATVRAVSNLLISETIP